MSEIRIAVVDRISLMETMGIEKITDEQSARSHQVNDSELSSRHLIGIRYKYKNLYNWRWGQNV
jgi:hypothetical protein